MTTTNFIGARIKITSPLKNRKLAKIYREVLKEEILKHFNKPDVANRLTKIFNDKARGIMR